jgi:hypothetical protein
MTTFTSTLPDELFKEWSEVASQLNLPKNKLVENALRIYLTQLKKAAYAKSYSRMAHDKDVLTLVEEGMAEYFVQLNAE